ncbi:hypothetical protein K9K77_02055 [Candidatus Babeliales bacterium]|nr:hypothetical protein [Candidatus Babeliales bacterium]
MEKKDTKQRKEKLLKCICSLPKKMITLHGAENMTEFLLHHLSQPECFNLMRAALFVDNPDFNHLKGIVGIEKHEAYKKDNHWDNPKDFSAHMENKAFNKKVRSIDQISSCRNKQEHEKTVHSLAQELSLCNPLFYSWPLKHDNHGLILFEINDPEEKSLIKEVMEEAVHLFGFCPVF